MAQFFQPSSNKRKSSKRQLSQKLHSVTIEQYNHDGQGIGYVNGKICFIQGGLPKETVRIRLLEEKAKLAKGQVVDIVSPCEQRIEPDCQHFSECGGCQLQMIDKNYQLDLKRQAVELLFKRHCGLEHLPWQASLSAHPWHYRRTARVGVWFEKKSNQFIVGFRRHNDKQLTPIDSCLLLPRPFDSLFTDFKALLPRLKLGYCVTHIEVFGCDNVNVVVVRHQKSLSLSDKQALISLGDKRDWFMVSEFDKGQFEPLSADVLPSLFYRLALSDRAFDLHFSIGDFIQVNSDVNQQMVKQAAQWLALGDDEHLLDLFCGIGNFSLPLASLCHHVVAVEGVSAMVERLESNAHVNQLDNVSCYQADLSQDYNLVQSKPVWLRQDYDKVLLDPARAGALGIISSIAYLQAKVAKTKRKKVLYVSCDPLTLARDSSILLEQGYRLVKIALMDMFTHTRHVEVMALFEQ